MKRFIYSILLLAAILLITPLTLPEGKATTAEEEAVSTDSTSTPLDSITTT